MSDDWVELEHDDWVISDDDDCDEDKYLKKIMQQFPSQNAEKSCAIERELWAPLDEFIIEDKELTTLHEKIIFMKKILDLKMAQAQMKIEVPEILDPSFGQEQRKPSKPRKFTIVDIIDEKQRKPSKPRKFTIVDIIDEKQL